MARRSLHTESFPVTAALLATFLGAVGVAATIRLPPLHAAQLWPIPWAVAGGLFAPQLLPYRSIRWIRELIGIAGRRHALERFSLVRLILDGDHVCRTLLRSR